MTRSPVACVWLLALATACGPQPLRDDVVAVDLHWQGDDLRAQVLTSTAGFQPTRGGAQLVRYELIDDTGEVVAAGRVADPRVQSWEDFGGPTPHAHDLPSDEGAVSLWLPSIAGRLRFVDLTTGAVMASGAFDPRRRVMPRLDPRADVGPLVQIHGTAPPHAALDLLFVAEGYTRSQMTKFHGDVQAATRGLLRIAPFDTHAARINVWALDVYSQESGVTDPAGATRDTAFDARKGVGELRRVVAVGAEGQAAARDLGRAHGADAVIVIVNSTEYGGSGGRPLVVTASPDVAPVLAHELGHSVFDLRDEYEHAGNVACGYYTTGPNIAKSARRADLPWRDLVATDAPLPTPPSNATAVPVGAYEGAAYCRSGVFRPAATCLMRSIGDTVCPVCRRTIDRYFAALDEVPVAPSEGCAGCPVPATCPETWRGDGLCDDCLGDDPDCEIEAATEACPEAWRGDGLCDDCLGDDPDCGGAPAEACPAAWRGDGLCDECLGDDPDCADAACPTQWHGDGVCDPCLGDDPDCAHAACPDQWRGDGVCDLCLSDDPDCTDATCPEEWRGDGVCDACLGDDPDCG